MVQQHGLKGVQVHRSPSYQHTDIGRVINNSRYKKEGIIEVVFLDHSSPFPVWVVGDIDRKPMTGDHVLVGYIGGRKDAPYLAGILKNLSYTTNFIEVDEKRIRVQIPVVDVGVMGGRAHNDTKTFLQNDGKLQERAYVELDGGKVKVYHPSGKHDTGNGAYVELSATETTLYHPANTSAKGTGAYIKINGSGIELYHPSGNVTVNVPSGILDVK